MFGCCKEKTKKIEDMTEGRLSIISLTTLCVGALLALATRKEDRKVVGLLAIIGLLIAALSTYGPVEHCGFTFTRGDDEDDFDFDFDDFETESCCDGNCNCGDDCSCGDNCTCNCGENESDFEVESD